MLYSKQDLELIIEQLIPIVKQAGKAILKYYKNSNPNRLDINIKQDNSPVTKADLASHDIIKNNLLNIKLYNKKLNLPLISEESDLNIINNINRLNWSSYWLVDPLDGTKEFLAHNNEFCINIALIYNNNPILGLIYIPTDNILYYGIYNIFDMQNNCAYKLDLNNNKKININTLNINNTNNNKLILTTSRRYKNNNKYNLFLDYLNKNKIDYKISTFGSAIKYCLIAEKQADLYLRFGLTSEWDSAAGECIVKATGGKVLDLYGISLKYNKSNSILNPEFIAIANSNINKNYDWFKIIADLNYDKP